VKYLPVC